MIRTWAVKGLLYHIVSYHILSYHIISYHIISYHIISYHIISYHIISYHIISHHIISLLRRLGFSKPTRSRVATSAPRAMAAVGAASGNSDHLSFAAKPFNFTEEEFYDLVWYGRIWYGMVWYGMLEPLPPFVKAPPHFKTPSQPKSRTFPIHI